MKLCSRSNNLQTEPRQQQIRGIAGPPNHPNLRKGCFARSDAILLIPKQIPAPREWARKACSIVAITSAGRPA